MEANGVENLVRAWFDGGVGSKTRQVVLPDDVKGTKLRAAGVKIHYMTKVEFDQWLVFAQQTAWKEYAKTVEGGHP